MANKKLPPEHVELIANDLLPNFIPKDKTETSLSFHFTANGVNYRVEYLKKDLKDERSWKLVKQEVVENEL